MTQFSHLSKSDEESRLFQVTAERGFLPRADPVLHLPTAFKAWAQVAGQLPKLLVADANPTAIGTGGTPFIPYVRNHPDETAGHLID